MGSPTPGDGLGGGGDDRFLACSTQRNAAEGQSQVTGGAAAAPLLQEAWLAVSVLPGEGGQDGSGRDAGPLFSHPLMEGFLLWLKSF